jgi:acyl carrier protein
MKRDRYLLNDFVSLINQIIPIQIDPASISKDTEIAGQLMIDSISLVSLMTLSEERFGISLAERAEAIANIRTVGDALELIASCQAVAGGAAALT